ncbi:hypothetical protein PCE1_001888 [Barthelona sp. PCE]
MKLDFSTQRAVPMGEARCIGWHESTKTLIVTDEFGKLHTFLYENGVLSDIIFTEEGPGSPILCLTVAQEEGFVFVGDMKGDITVFSINSEHGLDLEYQLHGHSDCVSSLYFKEGMLLSGGWDKELRYFNLSDLDEDSHLVVDAHEGNVYDFAVSDEGMLCSAGGKQLIIWADKGIPLNEYEFETLIRHVCVIGNDVYCYGNGGVLFKFGVGSHHIAQLNVSTGMGLSMAHMKSEGIPTVAVGVEDGLVAVINGSGSMELSEKLFVPGTPWDLKFIDGSLFVTVSDGRIVCFSREPVATVEERTEYHAEYGAYLKSRMERLANSTGGVIDGVSYDFVFDIDLENGSILKLGYNRGDNLWKVAWDFIAKNKLDSGFDQQIVSFLQRATQTGYNVEQR